MEDQTMFDLIFNSPLFDGEIFGLIDNGILALLALLGIDLDKRLGGDGVYGALFGALIGNSLSDFVGAISDPALRETALGITTGCLEILVLVYVGLYIYNRFIRVDDKMDKETFINVAIDTTNLPVVDDDGKQVRPTALFPKNYDKNK